MNGRTEKEEIQLFRLTLGQCKINSRWPTCSLKHDDPKRINFHLKSLSPFRRISGDVGAAVGGLASTCFLPFDAGKNFSFLLTLDRDVSMLFSAQQ